MLYKHCVGSFARVLSFMQAAALGSMGSKQSFAAQFTNVRFGPNLLEGVRIDWTSRAPGALLYRQGALGIMHDSGKLPVLPALPGSPSTSPGIHRGCHWREL